MLLFLLAALALVGRRGGDLTPGRTHQSRARRWLRWIVVLTALAMVLGLSAFAALAVRFAMVTPRLPPHKLGFVTVLTNPPHQPVVVSVFVSSQNDDLRVEVLQKPDQFEDPSKMPTVMLVVSGGAQFADLGSACTADHASDGLGPAIYRPVDCVHLQSCTESMLCQDETAGADVITFRPPRFNFRYGFVSGRVKGAIRHRAGYRTLVQTPWVTNALGYSGSTGEENDSVLAGAEHLTPTDDLHLEESTDNFATGFGHPDHAHSLLGVGVSDSVEQRVEWALPPFDSEFERWWGDCGDNPHCRTGPATSSVYFGVAQFVDPNGERWGQIGLVAAGAVFGLVGSAIVAAVAFGAKRLWDN